ncbi:unnamed protein product [Toxocara canis]|nr:unnamed protein product [Toxocara canis]
MEKGDQEVRTSYITSMDTWFGAMKAFSVISLLESLAVLALIKRSRFMGRQLSKATNQLEQENLRAEQKRLTRLYHRFDSVARFLSPCVFILFFIYYVIFVAQGDEMECVKE